MIDTKSLDLFAEIPVADYAAALKRCEQLLGSRPTFFPHDTEAVWELAEDRYVYVVQQPEHAGHAMHTLFIDDTDALVAQIADRGLDPVKRETYSNGVRKTTYRDPDGKRDGVRRSCNATSFWLELVLRVTAANEQDRTQVGVLTHRVQEVTGETIQLPYVDQGYTGKESAQAAAEEGVELHVVKLPEAKKGFVLLPRRGSSNAALHGRRVFDGWSEITSDCPRC